MEILSCTILVTEATDWMGIYHDRVPILLEEPEISLWLDGSLGARPATVALVSRFRSGWSSSE